MLVLSRKKHESILIGDDIEVFVLEIKRNQVKLGFRVPKAVPVLREELAGGPKDGRVPQEEAREALCPSSPTAVPVST